MNETPKVETPKVKTPKVKTPEVETPKAQTPKAEAPKVEVAMPESPTVPEQGEDPVRESIVLDDGPLFILQPRTYTPQPPAPLPSPMVKNSSPPQLKPQTNPQANPQLRPPSRPQTRSSSRPQSRAQNQAQSPRPQSRAQNQAQSPPRADKTQSQVFLDTRTSLRQRVSQKTTPPDSIQIPPRNAAESRLTRPLTGIPTSQTHMSMVPDNYVSDLEVAHHHRLPRANSHADFSMQMQPPVLSSPHSEQQQYYHPVRASPHSPLQQRPHTADAQPDQFRPSGYFPGHVRQQPSRMGGMSTLSSVTTATYDDAATMTSRGTSANGGRRLKKKKSAFGWLKKAFSLDEDERADFQARKAMQYQGQYFEDTSPKFLDGKRLR